MCILTGVRTDTEFAASTCLDPENTNFDDLGWLCALPQVSMGEINHSRISCAAGVLGFANGAGDSHF